MQYLTDAQEKTRVDTVVVEDTVAMHAVDAKLSAEPSHRTVYPAQLFAYFLTYVDGFFHKMGSFKNNWSSVINKGDNVY